MGVSLGTGFEVTDSERPPWLPGSHTGKPYHAAGRVSTLEAEGRRRPKSEGLNGRETPRPELKAGAFHETARVGARSRESSDCLASVPAQKPAACGDYCGGAAAAGVV